ncbi:UDP-2,4-diacetamido-2,4,6-trideoxy-beta-L-altropyranose hydrolase [Fontisubflavum oceani]|uniref:UDP-2,4-diacetamido-2,4, 6-trideoxy-beta-L-altropyranose hydrolase n=1 Tax=Fontisubflavum oceani TaxID=2978973 RepID=UPI0025B54854|nr:UDP-2,4-diacetamido-2,4,6-trideoxy-beta-L-altropyranose hydrolase [Fontisubflavum oceani]WJY21199.1 UDP-2,4-diacetamido-2,4,6-trideoxy-beta-L-altropyranose hydrolase [Fontisubflavum oceani]
MRLVFRADAGIAIGSGHVMRCLTLAHAFRDMGTEIAFVCSDGPGSMIDHLREDNIPVSALSANRPEAIDALGPADVLVVDHYGLDARWETSARDATGAQVVVIDDLADRAHACDVLIDHNMGRAPSDYNGLVPPAATVLTGPKFAMLRPEFATSRPNAMKNRVGRIPRQLLIAFGGTDPDNWTGRCLESLASLPAAGSLDVRVVMGPSAPHLGAVRRIADTAGGQVTVVSDVRNMAVEIASADIAIGAAGISALERSVLGLPTLLAVTAPNQAPGSRALVAAGAALCIDPDDLLDSISRGLEHMRAADTLAAMQSAAAGVTDGLGTSRIAEKILAHGR